MTAWIKTSVCCLKQRLTLAREAEHWGSKQVPRVSGIDGLETALFIISFPAPTLPQSASKFLPFAGWSLFCFEVVLEFQGKLMNNYFYGPSNVKFDSQILL